MKNILDIGAFLKRTGKPVWLQSQAAWNEPCVQWVDKVMRDNEVVKYFDFYAFSRDTHPGLDEAMQEWAGLNGQNGGWPLNVVLSAEGTPMLSFGALDREALNAFLSQLLLRLTIDAKNIESEAQFNFRKLEAISPLRLDQQANESSDLKKYVKYPLQQSIDGETLLSRGSFQSLQPASYKLLATVEGSDYGDKAVKYLLGQKIFDHIDGGFFRGLAKGSQVLAEKLLVDNAAMTDVLMTYYKNSNDPYLGECLNKQLAFLMSDFFDPQSGDFASALWAGADYFQISTNDLMEALSANERFWVQKFFNVQSDARFLSIQNSVQQMSLELTQGPVDIKLGLVTALKKLSRHRALKKGLCKAPPTTFASARVVQVLFDGLKIFEGYKSPMSIENRGQWEKLSALLRPLANSIRARFEKATGLKEQVAISLMTLAEAEYFLQHRHIGGEALFERECEIWLLSDIEDIIVRKSPQFGASLDLRDHLGSSTATLYLELCDRLKNLAKRLGQSSVEKRADILYAQSRARIAGPIQKLGLHAASAFQELTRV